MKKAILAIVVVAMLGWAIYEFVDSTDEADVEEEQGPISDNMITALPEEDGGAAPNTDDIGLSQGEMAPDFELETLEGETVRLSDYRGERVFLNFWATWCPPCRKEMPDMQKLYEKKDVEILAVDMLETESSEDNVPEFVEEYELTFPIPLDETSEVATAYEVIAYPTTYMIDSDGRIQFMAMGGIPYELMEQELEKMD